LILKRVIFDGLLTFQGEGCHEMGYFDRRYKHVGDNTIHLRREPMTMALKMMLWICGIVLKILNKRRRRSREFNPANQTWRYVGSGANLKIFQCFGVILSIASEMLDSLVASSSGELHLPHMNPEEFSAFY
jgi:hypothetical protein